MNAKITAARKEISSSQMAIPNISDPYEVNIHVDFFLAYISYIHMPGKEF